MSWLRNGGFLLVSVDMAQQSSLGGMLDESKMKAV